MSDSVKGILAMVAASTIWGLSAVYYKLLIHIPPVDLVAHRTVWSLMTFAVILLIRGRLPALVEALSDVRRVGRMALAALMVSANWLLFIFAVQVGRVTEASLGYYIFPLVAVVLGRLVFGERLRTLQWLSVGLATFAVVMLTVGLGVAPWISLVLALSFGTYGVLKKRLNVGPMVSVTAEVLILAGPALAWLVWRYGAADGGTVPIAGDWALLVFSGLLTAMPLILFSYASQRITMTSIGLVQYLNPTLQFACAVLVFREPFGLLQLGAFALIWIALALYSASVWSGEKARRKASRVSSAPLVH